jgi:hypothetical protein
MINVLFLEVYNVLIEAFPVKLDMTGFMRLDCPDEKIAGGAYVAPMALRDKITAMRKVV